MSVLLALAGAGGPTNLAAVAGTVTIAGGTATLRVQAPATAGTVTIAGGVATLTTAQPATAGTVTVAGGAATLTVSTNLSAAAGTVTVSGGTATITVQIPALAGLVDIAGGTASLEATGGDTLLTATAGTIAIEGGNATLEGGNPEQGGGVQVFGQVVPLRTIFPEVRELVGRAVIRVQVSGSLDVRRSVRASSGAGVTTMAIAGRVSHVGTCKVRLGSRHMARVAKRSEALTSQLFVRVTPRATAGRHRGARTATQAHLTATCSGFHRRAGVTGRLNLPMGDKSDGRLLTRASAPG